MTAPPVARPVIPLIVDVIVDTAPTPSVHIYTPIDECHVAPEWRELAREAIDDLNREIARRMVVFAGMPLGRVPPRGERTPPSCFTAMDLFAIARDAAHAVRLRKGLDFLIHAREQEQDGPDTEWLLVAHDHTNPAAVRN